MSKHFIDLLVESKDNLKLVESKEFNIDWEKAHEHINEINNLNDYVPILLKPLLNTDYIPKQDKKVRELFDKAYMIHRIANYPVLDEFINKDFLAWIEEHPQFQDIMITEDGSE